MTSAAQLIEQSGVGRSLIGSIKGQVGGKRRRGTGAGRRPTSFGDEVKKAWILSLGFKERGCSEVSPTWRSGMGMSLGGTCGLENM